MAVAIAGIITAGTINYVAWTNHKAFKAKEIAMAQQQMLITARATAKSIEEFIADRQENILVIAKNTIIRKGLSKGNVTPAIEHEVKEIYNAFKDHVDAIYLLNPQGIVLNRHPFWEDGRDRRGSDYSDKPGVLGVLKYREPYISDVFFTESGKLSISLLLPINYDAKLVGIARCVIKINTISEHFVKPIEVGEKGYAQLLDNRGILLSHPNPEHIGKHIMAPRKNIFPKHDWSDLEDVVEKMTKGQAGAGIYHSVWWEGKDKFVIVKKLTAYVPIQIGNKLWSVGLTMGYSEISRPINKNLVSLSFYGLLLTLLICAGGLTLYRTQKRKAVLEAISESANALRESEEKYRSFVQNFKGIAFKSNLDFTTIFFHGAIEEITGFREDEFNNRKVRWDTIIHPEDKLLISGSIEKIASVPNYSVEREYRIIRKDGQIGWAREFIQNNCDNSGIPTSVQGAIYDITERKKAEKALRESEERYRLLVDNANEAIFIIEDGVVKFPNLKTEEMTGYSDKELSEIPFINIIHPDDREMVLERRRKRLLGEKPPSTYSFRMINKSGGELLVQINTVLIAWEGKPATINFIRDITDQKRLEAQLQQAQKMEAMGTLAGGIAHDFNNLLMGIQGRTSLMRMDTNSSHPHNEHLRGIEDYVKSAADLTKQLLGFARGGKYEIKTTDLNEFIKKQNRMFGRTRKEINIRGRYEKNLWTTEIDQGQIEQVLLNLYFNSWQAMPGGGGLYIQTENIVIDESFNRPYHVEQGKYVKISLTDTGVGMDKSTQQRIFDPFFTTKEMGRGTGLGLASVYGIIKNHGGFIDVYSEKGEGTTFNIYLPASEKEVDKEKKSQEEVLKGAETVLLVDDEDMIVEVGQEIIENLGYEVLISKSGNEAIEIYKKNYDRIDMVILDMIMPEMGGGETYDKLKEINPGIKVLLSSGYSIDGEATKILERGCNGFIQKPFYMADFSKNIREILDKG